MSGTTQGISLKWDPKNLEIRTKSVEKTLEPLVTQVHYLKLQCSLHKLAVRKS